MDRQNNVERAVLTALAERVNPSSPTNSHPSIGNPNPLVERITLHNQIILHNFKLAKAKNYGCGLAGCERNFSILLIPNQVIYPKYCEHHRTEHRRQLFLKMAATIDVLTPRNSVDAFHPIPE